MLTFPSFFFQKLKEEAVALLWSYSASEVVSLRNGDVCCEVNVEGTSDIEPNAGLLVSGPRRG